MALDKELDFFKHKNSSQFQPIEQQHNTKNKNKINQILGAKISLSSTKKHFTDILSGTLIICAVPILTMFVLASTSAIVQTNINIDQQFTEARSRISENNTYYNLPMAELNINKLNNLTPFEKYETLKTIMLLNKPNLVNQFFTQLKKNNDSLSKNELTNLLFISIQTDKNDFDIKKYLIDNGADWTVDNYEFLKNSATNPFWRTYWINKFKSDPTMQNMYQYILKEAIPLKHKEIYNILD